MAKVGQLFQLGYVQDNRDALRRRLIAGIHGSSYFEQLAIVAEQFVVMPLKHIGSVMSEESERSIHIHHAARYREVSVIRLLAKARRQKRDNKEGDRRFAH